MGNMGEVGLNGVPIGLYFMGILIARGRLWISRWGRICIGMFRRKWYVEIGVLTVGEVGQGVLVRPALKALRAIL